VVVGHLVGRFNSAKSPVIGQNGRWDLYRRSDRQTPAPPPGQSDLKSKRARAWLLGFAWIDRPTTPAAALPAARSLSLSSLLPTVTHMMGQNNNNAARLQTF